MTDIALVTTTINVPEVLRRYRELDSDALFVIAGDLKTPTGGLHRLMAELGNYTYLSPTHQAGKYPGLSQAIGWNSIQRRNVAVAEAHRQGADIIVSIDDDNWPRDTEYFEDIRRAFAGPRDDVYLYTDPWFNIGDLADERFTYRGTPPSIRAASLSDAKANGSRREGFSGPAPTRLSRGGVERVGVVNGLIYGDPDVDAVERIVRSPVVSAYRHEARQGIVIDPTNTWSPINSQNTAWRAELAPLMLLPPDVGRYDDIWGSYIAQRVLSVTDYKVMFGKPYVTQWRNEHDLVRDLELELFGMRHADRFVELLREAPVEPSASITANLAAVLGHLAESREVPLPYKFFDAWTEHWAEVAVV
jgi:hypothetical protein